MRRREMNKANCDIALFSVPSHYSQLFSRLQIVTGVCTTTLRDHSHCAKTTSHHVRCSPSIHGIMHVHVPWIWDSPHRHTFTGTANATRQAVTHAPSSDSQARRRVYHARRHAGLPPHNAFTRSRCPEISHCMRLIPSERGRPRSCGYVLASYMRASRNKNTVHGRMKGLPC
ncbi:uncharacterized protein M421DRAFT_107019 [Didymella exigua CBS 183.55]|uniref:Uncharacterized protein n=1 Tax=Didymella exigua CBS 183.55 TaxID=1150837 RepID=A0A6A5S1V8_9PLEO|nr:uncharacterized protein M421DRAFT_107019 [Didymella exigua CBS 183.55]KAF1933873.1 hypothetical protein M421DRAFT_107019 [Didymella exigua CBS 183.55]